MQTFFKILAAFSVLVFFTGCKNVKIKNGEVPSQYLSEAKKLEGVYRGHFNGVRGDLVISFEGNRPVLTYKNNQGRDLLNNNCRSEIGLLEEVTIKGGTKDPRVSKVTFDFNPGRCSLMIQGRKLYVSFKEKNGNLRLTLSLLQEIRQEKICDLNPGAPPHVPPRYDCRYEQHPIYLYGTFEN